MVRPVDKEIIWDPDAQKKEKVPKENYINLDAKVIDRRLENWRIGRRQDYLSFREPFDLNFEDSGSGANILSVEKRVEEILYATRIVVQADTTATEHVSNSVDVNVLTSIDGKKFDTVPFAEMNLGDNQVKTMLVNPGPHYMIIAMDNNAAAVAKVKVKVFIQE